MPVPGSILVPRGLAGSKVKTAVRQKKEVSASDCFLHVACQMFVLHITNEVSYFCLTRKSLTRGYVPQQMVTKAALAVADGCDSASRGDENKQFKLWNWRVINKARSLHAGKCVRTGHCTHSYVWQLKLTEPDASFFFSTTVCTAYLFLRLPVLLTTREVLHGIPIGRYVFQKVCVLDAVLWAYFLWVIWFWVASQSSCNVKSRCTIQL